MRLRDGLSVIAFLAVAIWFSRGLLERERPSFRNLAPVPQTQLVLTVALSLIAVMTLPQLWLYLTARSSRRRSVVPPALTIGTLAFCSLATVPMIGAVGILSAIQAAVIFQLCRRRYRLSVAAILAVQSAILLLVGTTPIWWVR